jgi:hypothetical protein
MLVTDQVATASCTDRVQEWFRTFEAKLLAQEDTKYKTRKSFVEEMNGTVKKVS